MKVNGYMNKSFIVPAIIKMSEKQIKVIDVSKSSYFYKVNVRWA